jgi:hypothetical protein
MGSEVLERDLPAARREAHTFRQIAVHGVVER